MNLGFTICRVMLREWWEDWYKGATTTSVLPACGEPVVELVVTFVASLLSEVVTRQTTKVLTRFLYMSEIVRVH